MFINNVIMPMHKVRRLFTPDNGQCQLISQVNQTSHSLPNENTPVSVMESAGFSIIEIGLNK